MGCVLFLLLDLLKTTTFFLVEENYYLLEGWIVKFNSGRLVRNLNISFFLELKLSVSLLLLIFFSPCFLRDQGSKAYQCNLSLRVCNHLPVVPHNHYDLQISNYPQLFSC